jgi:hypothetical protein
MYNFRVDVLQCDYMEHVSRVVEVRAVPWGHVAMLPCSQLDKSNEKKKLKTNYIDRSYIHLLECDLQVSLPFSQHICEENPYLIRCILLTLYLRNFYKWGTKNT